MKNTVTSQKIIEIYTETEYWAEGPEHVSKVISTLLHAAHCLFNDYP